VVLVIALGIGVFYIVNGGWKTAGQKQDDYYHRFLPLQAAAHGDMEPLNKENELRKKNGQPLLVYKSIDSAPPSAEGLRLAEEFQKKLQQRGNGAAPSNAPAAGATR